MQALKLNDSNLATHEQLGLQLIDLKQYGTARAHLEVVLKSDPKRWQIHNALGIAADMERNHERAIEHYITALELEPRSASILNNLGYSHYLAGNNSRAKQHFLAAVALEPTYRPAIVNLGLANARSGNYRRALELLTRTMSPPAAYNDTGFIAFKNGDLNEAQALLRQALELSPTYYETAARNLRLVEDQLRSNAGTVQIVKPEQRTLRTRTRSECIDNSMEEVRAGVRHILDVVADCESSTERN